MSENSARGMREKNDALLSVQMQSLIEEALSIESHLEEEEITEDRDTSKRIKWMAQRAGVLPLGIIDDELRNLDQLDDHHQMRTILGKLLSAVWFAFGHQESRHAT